MPKWFFFKIQALQETDIIKQDEIHCTGKSCAVHFLRKVDWSHFFPCLFGVYVCLHSCVCLHIEVELCMCACEDQRSVLAVFLISVLSFWRQELSQSYPVHRMSALPSLALHLHAAGCGFVHVSCRFELGFYCLLCPLSIRLALEGIIIFDHNLQRQPTTVTCTTHEA